MLSIKNVDFIVAPYNALGSPAILEAAEKGIKIYAIEENKTALNITAEKLGLKDKITIARTYNECLKMIKGESLISQY